MLSEGVILGFVTAAFWGASPILYRWGGENLSSVEINFVRTVGAFASVIVINFIMNSWKLVMVQLPLWVWGLFCGSLLLGLFIGDSLFFSGIKLIGVGRCSVISSSYPLTTMLFAWIFLNEKMSFKFLIAGLIIVLGVYLLYGEESPTGNPKDMAIKGYILSLGVSLSWGLSLALIKIISDYFSPVSFMTWRVGILLIITLVSMGFKFRKLSPALKKPKNWFILGIAGTVGIGVSYLTFVRALQLAPVSQIGIITGTSPLLTTLLAALFYHEKITLRSGIGSGLIIAGGLLASV